MPRQGMNPLRESAAVSKIKDIVFGVVTHLPSSEGYHSQRFDVVRSCLQSMRNNAHKDHTFIIWDNGSSDFFREWVANEFKADIFILSENIGKTAARSAMMQMVPLSTLFCYSDDDILYFDNWLKPQMEVLNHFRGASIVSGYPNRMMFNWAVQTAINYGKKHGKVEIGKFIPEEWERDYAESIGRDWEKHLQLSEGVQDIKIHVNGKWAYATSHHCQFIGYAVNLIQGVHLDNMAMGDERVFDEAMNKIGPRLSTIERYCRHMGNVIDERLQEDLEKAIK